MPPGNEVSALRSPYASNKFDTASFTVGAEASDAIAVTVQLKTPKRNNPAARMAFDWYLSDDPAGNGFVATAPDGGVAAGASGKVLQTVTGKMGKATTTTAGLAVLAITHAAGAKTVYLVVVMPDGSVSVSGAITFAA